jgi:hypothetical protein
MTDTPKTGAAPGAREFYDKWIEDEARDSYESQGEMCVVFAEAYADSVTADLRAQLERAQAELEQERKADAEIQEMMAKYVADNERLGRAPAEARAALKTGTYEIAICDDCLIEWKLDKQPRQLVPCDNCGKQLQVVTVVTRAQGGARH